MHLSKQQNILITFALLPVVLNLLINGFYVGILARTSVALFWVNDFIQWVVLPIVLLITLAKKASINPKNYGFDIGALHWRSFILGTLAVFITGYLSFVWARHLSWLWLGQPTGFFSLVNIFPSGLWKNISLIYSSFTAGIVESIFFIGLPWLLCHNVQKSPSRVAFSVLTSLIFATAHWEQGLHVMVGSFSFNIIACFWFFRLGSLWPIAAGHALTDLVVLS